MLKDLGFVRAPASCTHTSKLAEAEESEIHPSSSFQMKFQSVSRQITEFT